METALKADHKNIPLEGYKGIEPLEVLLLLVVFIAPVWPRYATIFIEGIPNIYPTRLIIFTLVFVWAASLLGFRQVARPIMESYRADRTLFHCLIALFAVKFMSLLASDNFKASLFSFTDDAFSWFLLFLAAITILKNTQLLYRIVFVMILSSILISLYGLYEAYLGYNLLDPLVFDPQKLVISPRAHRIRSVFSNPLVLAEYQVFIIPVIVLLLNYSRSKALKGFYLFAFILSFSNIILTKSRGAMLIALIIVIILFILKSREMIKNKYGSTRFLIVYTSLISILIFALLFIPFMINITKGRTFTEKTSSYGRVTQLQKGIPLVLKRPLLGYGQGRSGYALTHGVRHTSIDNYYLVLSMESGLVALALFIYIFYHQIKLSFDLYNKTEGFLKTISAIVGVSLTGIFIFMTVLSIDYIFPLIFIFFAILSFIRKSIAPALPTHMTTEQP